jgi:putative membrane protein
MAMKWGFANSLRPNERSFLHRIDRIVWRSFALLVLTMTVSSFHISTVSLFIVSTLMFVTCALSSLHLFGGPRALRFIALAVGIGFFAEYTGHHYGWFFGNYKFTDALGFRLFAVPVTIPMMWFNLTYIGYVMGNLLVFHAPTDATRKPRWSLASSIVSAMLVTAYDLGADPYMVFSVKAWIMEITDGGWFGETLQGFVGWFVVALVILVSFKLSIRNTPSTSVVPFRKLDALIPVLILAALTGFQITHGEPIETRVIAVFALGLPLTVALLNWPHWNWNASTEGAERA